MSQANAKPANHQPGMANLAFVEALYAQYLGNPSSVAPDWRVYFASLAEQNRYLLDWEMHAADQRLR